MEFEKLFGLIHDLDSSQRRNLSLYAGGKKNTRPYKLYQRILKFQELTDETSSKIRGQMFLEPHQFIQDREKLARWIISSIVGGQNGKISTLAFIKQSFLYKADTLARKAFLNEFKRLTNHKSSGNWRRCMTWYLSCKTIMQSKSNGRMILNGSKRTRLMKACLTLPSRLQGKTTKER